MFENEQDFNNFTDYLLFVATLQPASSNETKAKNLLLSLLMMKK